MSNLIDLQQHIGITFDNFSLLKQAFTHSSYVNEHRGQDVHDNERLEFLGDAVLELLISEYLFGQYPDLPEGDLTRLRASIVCEPALVKFAETLRFGDYLLLGKGEEMTGGRTRPALLADVFEAFIGALYMDKGLEKTRMFLAKHVLPFVQQERQTDFHDFKSKLQEHVQQHGLGFVEYHIIDERGPAHDREFVSQVLMNDDVLGQGTGRSKKEAEQNAAQEALHRLNVLL